MQRKVTASEVAYPVAQTLGESIGINAAASPQAPAIVFPDRTVLTYEALRQQIERVGVALKHAGIGARNRVAIVMPDGPELAITIAAVACHATVVPLNPQLTATEIDDLVASLRLDAVILAEGADIPAREAARRHGLCLFEASARESGVDLTPRTPPLSPAAQDIIGVGLDDPAMILRTSGTTARPKLVPVTHRNLQSMAARRQSWFGLGPRDRALCVMPLYYAQGSFNTLFAQLILGGSLACPARSSGANFCGWLAEFKPTWYSAGPTFHRSVLEQARSLPKSELRHSLRFIQSGAAPLPQAIHEGLESVFGVPVVDSYGLSEAGNIAANSVAPAGRRRGTVGKPWRGELGIRSEDGRIVDTGGPGEIVVRGPGLTPGYIGDPEANRAAFVDGWFRTGDLGRIDADGFLTVAGRIKELINRGGEKIAPAEIDDALLRHPGVAEAAAFPVPHPRLGEDVVAAVIIQPGATVTPLELRQFLQASLVPFKIPRRIHLVASLPKGDTGKVLRQKLSQIFGGGASARSAINWGSPLEIEIAEIWQRLLERDDIGPEDEFFEMGGDSLLATQMLLELERLTGRVLPETLLFETATIRQLAENLVHKNAEADQNLLVQLQPGTNKPPFIFIDGDFWGGGYYTRNIARLLGPDYPFYALRSHGLHSEDIPSIEQMAQDYMRRIRAARLNGPYRLAGHCNGALIAWELAHQLEVAGERVELVALIEPISLNARTSVRLIARILDTILRIIAADPADRERRMASAMSLVWRTVRQTGERREAWAAFAKSFAGRAGRKTVKLLHGQDGASKRADSVDAIAFKIGETNQQLAGRLTRLLKEYQRRMARYIPAPVAADILCFVAESHTHSTEYAGDVWRNLAANCEVAVVPGDHLTCITTHSESLVNRLRERLAALDRSRKPAGVETR